MKQKRFGCTKEELLPFVKKMQQEYMQSLVNNFDKSKIPFWTLSITSSTESDTQTYTLLCPDCRQTFTYNRQKNSSLGNPVCPHCGFQSQYSSWGTASFSPVNFQSEVWFSGGNRTMVIEHEGFLIAANISGSCILRDNGTAPELSAKQPNVTSVIAAGDKTAVYYHVETPDDISEGDWKKKQFKAASHYFNPVRSGYVNPIVIPVCSEIQDWMDKHSYTNFDDVINHYKSNRKTYSVTKPTVDKTKVRPIHLDSFFERIKNNAVCFIRSEFDAVLGIERKYYYCEHCKKEFITEDEADRPSRIIDTCYNYRHSYQSHASVMCPHCKTAGELLWQTKNDNIPLGQVAILQDYSDSNVKDGVFVRVVDTEVKVGLDGENIPFYSFSYSLNSYAALLNKEKEKPLCFRLDGSSWINDSIRGFNSYEYEDFIIDAAPGSWLAYSGFSEYFGEKNRFVRKFHRCDDISRYFLALAKYPVIEKLVKVGYGDVIKRTINLPSTNVEYASFVEQVKGKTTISEVTGLPAKIAVKVADWIDYVHDIAYFRSLYNMDKTASAEDLIYAKENKYSSVDVVFNTLKGITLKSINEYMEGVRVHQCFPPSEAFGFWRDYISTCADIGMNVNDKSVKYPNSLKREHDKVIAKRTFVKNEKQAAAFAEQVARCQEKFGYENRDFIIRAPKDTKELFEEGRILCHSVGSYTDIISRGDTCIMFIRKKDAPDTPWYTLEVREKDNKIPEIRGFCNRLVDEEVEVPLCKFLAKWANSHHLDIDSALRTAKKYR